MGEKQIGKLGEVEVKEEEPATQRRRDYTDLGLDLGEREEQVVCHSSALALAMTGSMSENRDVSLAIFIISVSGSESLASFTNRIFYLSRTPDFRMAFDAAKRNKRFGRIQCQRAAAEEREREEYSSAERQ